MVQKSTDEHGYGVGIVEPGFCVHQAVLTGSHNYSLHYNLTALEDDTVVAYLSRKNFEDSLKSLNTEMIAEYNNYLSDLPAFERLSKVTKNKMLTASKRMTVPKGWKFNSNDHPTKFCVILKGTFQLTYGKPAESYTGKDNSGKNFNMKKLILGN